MRAMRARRAAPVRRSLRGNVDRNFNDVKDGECVEEVVPYVGTWIEITTLLFLQPLPSVVPYVGTWIEMPIRHQSRSRE